MKKSIILALTAVMALSALTGCATSNNDTSSVGVSSINASSNASINTPNSAVVSSSNASNVTSTSSTTIGGEITESAASASSLGLTEGEEQYIQKLFKCMPGANYSSIYALDDQKVMQFVENILRYEETTGDIFFVNYSKNSSGDITIDMDTASKISKTVFNYTLQHTSDYLVGSSYVFLSASAARIPEISYTKAVQRIGNLYQFNYNLTYNTGSVLGHVGSIYRSNDSSFPFTIQSITLNDNEPDED